MPYSEWSGLRTRASLLFRLQQMPDDQRAWEQFTVQYSPQVFAWCQRWGLQEADAADLTQTVLFHVAQRLREFQYDPAKRFRGWLKTITQHACVDLYRSRRRTAIGTGDSEILKLLDSAEARDDLAERLQETFDLELLQQAYEEVRARVEDRTWQAFVLTAIKGLKGADAAKHLGMNVGAVFVAKSKVLKMLQEIVRGCEENP